MGDNCLITILQHLQMTCRTVKGFATMEAVPCKLPLTQHSCNSYQGSLGFIIFSLWKTSNSLDALQCFCFLGGIIKQHPNAGYGSKETTLSPSLMQLPELKRAVTRTVDVGDLPHFLQRVQNMPTLGSSH